MHEIFIIYVYLKNHFFKIILEGGNNYLKNNKSYAVRLNTHASLLTCFVRLSYFILAVFMCECLGKHSCMSSLFPIAILNGSILFHSLKAINNWKQILQTNLYSPFPFCVPDKRKKKSRIWKIFCLLAYYEWNFLFLLSETWKTVETEY